MARAEKLSRAEQKALRPLQILDAAFEEFVARGFSATRLEDVAQRVGITKGTIYVYFPTKEDLFSATIRHISKPLEDLLRDSKDVSGNHKEKICNMLHLFYERISGDRHSRELIRLVISEGSRFPSVVTAHHDELIAPLFGLAQAVIDEGVAAGEFRDAPAALASVVVAPVIANMVETLIFGRPRADDIPAYIRAHVDLVLNGLAVTRS
jgi:AcrR family transcriptional regulator